MYSSRTQRILKNAKKRKYSEVQYSEKTIESTTEFSSDDDKPQRSDDDKPPCSDDDKPQRSDELLAPEYQFLVDDVFDDDIRDPDFEPNENDHSSDSDNNAGKINFDLHNTLREIVNNNINPDTIAAVNSELLNNTEESISKGETEVAEDFEKENNDKDNEKEKKIKKKRNRTLETQIEHNKIKHPLRLPCHCKLKCFDNITENQRVEIYEEYWKLDRHKQRVWLSAKVTEKKSKRKLQEGGRRDYTRQYILPKKDDEGSMIDVRVCQIFFLATLGYNNANILTTLRKSLKGDNGNLRITPCPDKRGKHPPINKKDRNLLQEHVKLFNPRPSHYAREHAPNRLYLPPDLTIKFMHQDYCTKYPENKVCYEVYRKVVEEMNISFYESTPEKCGLCQSIEHGDDPANNAHLKEEHLSKVSWIRKEYDTDSEIDDEKIRVFACDMQKVVLLPRMPDSKEAFFTSRLIVFNQTFASMQKKNQHYLILWHEAISGRRAEDVTSAFIKLLYINRTCEKIIIWMDNCVGQNKNFTLYSAILQYVNSDYCTTNEIYLKYLVKGHTFMAADGIHGRIEQECRRKKNIYDFDDFIDACEKSSTRSKIILLQPNDFYKFGNELKKTRKEGDSACLPHFRDIVMAKFTKGSQEICCVTNYYTNNFMSTKGVLKKKCNLKKKLEGLDAPRGISNAKKARIISEILPQMPQNRRKFWNELPTNEASDDLLDDGL